MACGPRFYACLSSAPYRMDTRFARLRAGCLRGLGRVCSCAGAHSVSLEGAGTTRVAQYLQKWSAEYALAMERELEITPSRLGACETEAMSVGAPPRYEARLVNDLLRELTWRTVAARPMGGTEHINVRNLRAALRHALHEVRGPSALRVLSVLDSRVSIGALGKGRSPSRQLNGELRAMLTDILARDLYFGFFFGPTQTSRRLPRPARPASSHAQSLRHRLPIAATATSLFFSARPASCPAMPRTFWRARVRRSTRFCTRPRNSAPPWGGLRLPPGEQLRAKPPPQVLLTGVPRDKK